MPSSQTHLQTITNKIKELHVSMSKDLEDALKTNKTCPNGNVSAARRARVTSSELRDLYKRYRVASKIIGKKQ